MSPTSIENILAGMDEVDSCVNMLEQYAEKDRGNKHGLKLEASNVLFSWLIYMKKTLCC